MDKDLLGLEDLYDALTMLPIFYDYTEKGIKGVSELALLLNNSEALINFLIYFSNKQIRFPKIEDVELLLRMILAYKDNMVNNVKPTSILFYNALYKYQVKPTEENKEIFRRLSRYLKRVKRKKDFPNR